MSSGPFDEIKNNISREHRDCFKMPDNGHYHFGLTVHSVQDFISDWMGSVNDYYILYSRSLYEAFKPYQTLSPLEVIYETGEESRSFNDDRPEPKFHVGIDGTNVNNADI